MPIVLGLLSAASFGAADYLGGAATRRAPVTPVVLGQQVSGLLLGVLLLAVFGIRGEPFLRDVLLASGVGLCGLAGLVLLFRGLAIGRMALVGPLSALVVAGVPVLWGVGTGESLSVGNAVGVALSISAVALVTREHGDRPEALEPGPSGDSVVAPVLHALGAGLAFGACFVLFGETSAGSGYWPLLVARLVTIAVLVVVMAVRRDRVLAPPGVRGSVAGAGVADIVGNVFFLASVREGALAIVAPVAALYPAGTVLLARTFLGETMTRPQVAGFLLTLPALVLLSSG